MSRIKNIECFPVKLPRDYAAAKGTAGSPHELRGTGEYRWSAHFPALYSVQFETALVRVQLDDGRVGWGEAQAPLAPEVATAIVRGLLAPSLIGEEFNGGRNELERLWGRMYSTMRVRGQTGGFMLDAISGVDLALWDLAGQLAGKSVSSLIAGSAARPKVSAYVSGIPGVDAGAKLGYVREKWAAGFRTYKIYFDSQWQDLLDSIDALRAEFNGISIAVDALWHLPAGQETKCARTLAEREVIWLECPLMPEDVDGHVRLAREGGVPLALGESYRTRFDAAPFLREGVVKYWQPDLGRSGITESLVLARMAEEAGAAIVPHTSIALPPQMAAAVHLAAALPNCPMGEYNPSVLEFANRLAEIKMEDAAYRVPTGPGWGLALESLSDLVK